MVEESQTERSRPLATDSRTIHVFAWLWGVHVLCEQAKWDDWAKSPLEAVMTILAWLVILLPGRMWLFMALVSVQVLSFIDRMPWIVNHQLAALVVLLVFLAAVGVVRSKSREPMDWTTVFEHFAPTGRALLLIVYGWAAFHKFNTEFFDPARSCAVIQYMAWAEVLPVLPTGRSAQWASIILPLILEVSVAPLLLFRRTRWLGLLVAAGMHWVFGVAAFYRFSSMAYAMLLLFVPDAVRTQCFNMIEQSRMWESIHQFIAQRQRMYRLAVALFICVATAVVLWQLRWDGRSMGFPVYRPMTGYSRSSISIAFQSLWLVFGMLCVLGVIVAWRRTIRTGPKSWLSAWALVRPRLWWFALFAAVAAINGAQPYLGLNTESAFAMYSNLRTEDSKSNHLLIQEPIYLVDFQNDLVSIIESSDPSLAAAAEDGYRFTWFEFRSYVHRQQAVAEEPIMIVYQRAGQVHRVEDARMSPIFTRSDTLFRKFLHFRTVAPQEASACMH